MRCFRRILFIRLVYSMLSMLVRKEFCIFIIFGIWMLQFQLLFYVGILSKRKRQLL